MIGKHPTLSPVWPQVKASIIRHGGGSVGKVGVNVTHAPVVQAAPAQIEIKRGPGRPKGSKTRISADSVQAAPTPAPKSDDMEARMARIEAALLALVS